MTRWIPAVLMVFGVGALATAMTVRRQPEADRGACASCSHDKAIAAKPEPKAGEACAHDHGLAKATGAASAACSHDKAIAAKPEVKTGEACAHDHGLAKATGAASAACSHDKAVAAKPEVKTGEACAGESCGACAGSGGCCRNQGGEGVSPDGTKESVSMPMGRGPMWARGSGNGAGMGMGMGRGGMGMGCGMVLRDAIAEGRVDGELVQSLVNGPNGNAERGKAVFLQNCAMCHKVGDLGNEIAPNLTNRPRHNPMYVLANVSHPNAVIPAEYQVYVVVTSTGEIVSGIRVAETEESITLLNATDGCREIRRETIEEMRESDKSLMPENLIESLGEEALRDLLSFLRS